MRVQPQETPAQMTVEDKVRETNRRLNVVEMQLARLDRTINGLRPSAEGKADGKVPEVTLHRLLDEGSCTLAAIEESIEWITRGLGFTNPAAIGKERAELS